MTSGYADSCADLAYAARLGAQSIVTPNSEPSPTRDLDWSFPDTVDGIHSALSLGANTLWANTILHSRHALMQIRDELDERRIRIVGQNPIDVERFDDKEFTNRWLAGHQKLRTAFPRYALLEKGGNEGVLEELELDLPVVVKPVRGRGSAGVSKAQTREEINEAVSALFEDSDAVMVEVSGSHT